MERSLSLSKTAPATRSYRWRAAILLLSAVFFLPGFSGCQTLLFAPIWMMKGNDVDPEFKDQVKAIPKESKLVVICRSPYQSLFGGDNPSRSLSLILTKKLSEKIDEKNKKKFEWVTIDKVEAMFDESGFANESYERMGEKVGADYVIGIDIDSFNIHQSSQFYQGKAKVKVKLVKVDGGEVIFSKSIPQYVYPPNVPMSINDVGAEDFQSMFVIKIADEIGCLFYPYNPHDKVALDSDVARLR